ncbi:hypothetical protein Tco_0079226 [Tanacetum coccineum]
MRGYELIVKAKRSEVDESSDERKVYEVVSTRNDPEAHVAASHWWIQLAYEMKMPPTPTWAIYTHAQQQLEGN